MNTTKAIRNAKFLEALEYIDPSIIAQVAENIKAPDITPASGKSKVMRSLKYVAALAACLMLMSTLIPVVQYVSGNLNSLLPGGWWGETTAGETTVGETTEETTETETIPEETTEEKIFGEDTLIIEIVEDTLTQKELDAINAAWQPGNFADSLEDVGFLSGSKYIYGKYSGCIVLGWRDMLTAIFYERVAGFSFMCSTGGIRVYYNGDFYDLLEAYENGYLSYDEIRELWNLHYKYIRNKEKASNTIDYPLTQEKLDIINVAYEARFGEGKVFAKSYKSVLYCDAPDLPAIRYDYCIGTTSGLFLGEYDEKYGDRTVTINDVTFELKNRAIYYHDFNGNIYTLEEAYENKRVAFADIRLLCLYHNKYVLSQDVEQ